MTNHTHQTQSYLIEHSELRDRAVSECGERLHPKLQRQVLCEHNNWKKGTKVTVLGRDGDIAADTTRLRTIANVLYQEKQLRGI